MKMDNLIIVKETDKYLMCLCPNPNHQDTEPSLYINKVQIRDKPKGYYYCFGCGITGTIEEEKVDFLCQKPSNYRESDVKSEKDFNALHDEYFKEEFCRGYGEGLGKKWDVKPTVIWECGCGWDNNAHTFPMYNQNNEVIGIQRRFPNGFKCMVEGSRLGLFVPNTLSGGEIVFIAEGVSDLCCLLDLGFEGIAKPNALVGNDLVYNWLKKHKPYWKKVVVIADRDKAGIEGANALTLHIDSIGDRSVVFVPAQNDLRETTGLLGKDEMRAQLIFTMGL